MIVTILHYNREYQWQLTHIIKEIDDAAAYITRNCNDPDAWKILSVKDKHIEVDRCHEKEHLLDVDPVSYAREMALPFGYNDIMSITLLKLVGAFILILLLLLGILGFSMFRWALNVGGLPLNRKDGKVD